jgi:hypothetical protein
MPAVAGGLADAVYGKYTSMIAMTIVKFVGRPCEIFITQKQWRNPRGIRIPLGCMQRTLLLLDHLKSPHAIGRNRVTCRYGFFWSIDPQGSQTWRFCIATHVENIATDVALQGTGHRFLAVKLPVCQCRSLLPLLAGLLKETVCKKVSQWLRYTGGTVTIMGIANTWENSSLFGLSFPLKSLPRNGFICESTQQSVNYILYIHLN